MASSKMYPEQLAILSACGEHCRLEVVNFAGFRVAVEISSVAFVFLGGTSSLTVHQ
jgi:hypothetical protein